MSETDDRLVGDHVWEVYPATRRPTSRGALATRLGVFVALVGWEPMEGRSEVPWRP